jgi:hypothetical protein
MRLAPVLELSQRELGLSGNPNLAPLHSNLQLEWAHIYVPDPLCKEVLRGPLCGPSGNWLCLWNNAGRLPSLLAESYCKIQGTLTAGDSEASLSEVLGKPELIVTRRRESDCPRASAIATNPKNLPSGYDSVG